MVGLEPTTSSGGYPEVLYLNGGATPLSYTREVGWPPLH